MPVKQGREGVRQEMHKTCTKCGETKVLSEFNRQMKNKDGRRQPCKECQNVQGRDYYVRNREKMIAWQHGFNRMEHRGAYARKYQTERNRRLRDKAATRPRPKACEACGATGVPLCFDHDHDTGWFRGWLCNRCNRALGLLGDSVDVLRRLIQYLEAARCR